MTIRYASRRSYEEAVLSGLTSRVQYTILKALYVQARPMTRRQIEVATGLRISTVTPAVYALLDAKMIEVHHQDKDPLSGHLADFLVPAYGEPTQEPMQLQMEA